MTIVAGMSQVKYAKESAEFKKGFLAKLECKDFVRQCLSDDEIEILVGPTFDRPTPSFQCRFSVPECSVRTVVHKIHNLPERLSWDGGTNGTLDLDTYDVEEISNNDGTHKTVRITASMPALGGVISSREYLDLNDFEISKDESKAMIWSSGLDSVLAMPVAKGRVRGQNFPCGMTFEQDGSNVKAR